MRDYEFPLREKVLFYLDYAARKTITNWFEVRKPRLKLFVYEVLYSGAKLLDRQLVIKSPFRTAYAETRFGRFSIRPGTADMSMVSPAFERRDLNFLLKTMKHLRGKNKRILFLDIGADLGTFTVSVGNAFKKDKGVLLAAFEPAGPSFSLLEENVSLNSLREKTALFNIALWSEDDKELDFGFNPEAPGSSGLKTKGPSFKVAKIKTKTLDSILGEMAADFEALVIKMDIEGAEIEVLKGAERTLKKGKEIYLLAEDFIRPEVVGYLQGIGAEFIRKLTPYNSFWKIKKFI